MGGGSGPEFTTERNFEEGVINKNFNNLSPFVLGEFGVSGSAGGAAFEDSAD